MFWVYYHSNVELKTILASNSPPKVFFLLWLYFATISLFLRNINTGDGLVALCTPDEWLKMSVFVAVNKFEFESLSFTEQNTITESDEPSRSSLHFGRSSVLNLVSFFLAVGKGCWFTCTAVTAIQETQTHTTCDFSFLHTVEKWGHWRWTAKVGKSGSGT